MFLLSPSPYLLNFQVTCLFALVLKVMQFLMLCYDLQGGELISKSLFRSQKSEVLSKLLWKALMDVTPMTVKGKTKFLKVMLKKQIYMNEFTEMGNDPDISDKLFEIE